MKVAADQFVVDVKGRKKAVIVAATRYEQIMEDLHDLAVVAERRSEAPPQARWPLIVSFSSRHCKKISAG